jgi:hypothetical protein
MNTKPWMIALAVRPSSCSRSYCVLLSSSGWRGSYAIKSKNKKKKKKKKTRKRKMTEREATKKKEEKRHT